MRPTAYSIHSWIGPLLRDSLDRRSPVVGVVSLCVFQITAPLDKRRRQFHGKIRKVREVTREEGKSGKRQAVVYEATHLQWQPIVNYSGACMDHTPYFLFCL